MGKRKRRPNFRRKNRNLSQDEELKILFLYRKRLFQICELADIFRIPEKHIREIIQKVDPFFSDVTEELPVTRLSFVLDEMYSRAIQKVAARIALKGKEVSCQELLEFGIDLVCWVYGLKTVTFPGVRIRHTEVSRETHPMPSKFTILRGLAKCSGGVRKLVVYNQIAKKRKGEDVKFAKTGYGKSITKGNISKICLYYGINPWFVKAHYPNKGNDGYLSLGKLKKMSDLSIDEICEITRFERRRAKKFFLAHGLKIKMRRTRFVEKWVEGKNSLTEK